MRARRAEEDQAEVGRGAAAHRASIIAEALDINRGRLPAAVGPCVS